MTGRRFSGVLILFFLAATLRAQSPVSDRTKILSAIQDIARLGDPVTSSDYDASNIEKYDPQLAPDLKLYGLRGLTVQQWSTARGMARVTLFEMIDAPAAYGAYTLQRSRLTGETTPILVGAASFLHAGQLYFWQSNYDVRIEAAPELRDQLAEAVSRKIFGRSEKPPVAAYLPGVNLVEGSEKYILRPDLIEASSGLNSANLGFEFSAEAATATYRRDGETARLLLMLYPTQHIARKHADQLPPVGPAMFIKRAGPLMAIVYGSRSEALATAILDEVGHEFKITWDEPPPGLGLGTMIITIFTFIGLALAFTTIVGVSFGGLRVFVKSRFPNSVFDRPEKMEIIQLKLDQGVTDRQIGDGSGAARP
jgi:hypothetical protein